MSFLQKIVEKVLRTSSSRIGIVLSKFYLVNKFSCLVEENEKVDLQYTATSWGQQDYSNLIHRFTSPPPATPAEYPETDA